MNFTVSMKRPRPSTPPILLDPQSSSIRLQQLESDWSRLPYDLTSTIANRFDAIEDFLSFSAVCKSWRSVKSEMGWIPWAKIPWIMLGDNHSYNVPMRQCFSMSKFKVHNFPNFKDGDCRYWGSCYGWVAAVSKDEFFLLNPITESRIKLPAESALVNQNSANGSIFDTIHRAYVFKIGKSLMVFAIYGPKYRLAFVRVGDSEWSTVQSPSPPNFCDVVCFKDRIVALSMIGKVYLVNIDGSAPLKCIANCPPVRNWQQLYLVECSGRLLMVVYYEKEVRRIEVGFTVFIFDIRSNKWTVLKDLGECALLVDNHRCSSIPAYGIFRSNCIYYVKDNLDSFLIWQQNYIGNLVFVYNLADNTVDVQNVGENYQYSSPTWFIPELW